MKTNAAIRSALPLVATSERTLGAGVSPPIGLTAQQLTPAEIDDARRALEIIREAGFSTLCEAVGAVLPTDHLSRLVLREIESDSEADEKSYAALDEKLAPRLLTHSERERFRELGKRVSERKLEFDKRVVKLHEKPRLTSRERTELQELQKARLLSERGRVAELQVKRRLTAAEHAELQELEELELLREKRRSSWEDSTDEDSHFNPDADYIAHCLRWLRGHDVIAAVIEQPDLLRRTIRNSRGRSQGARRAPARITSTEDNERFASCLRGVGDFIAADAEHSNALSAAWQRDPANTMRRLSTFIEMCIARRCSRNFDTRADEVAVLDIEPAAQAMSKRRKNPVTLSAARQTLQNDMEEGPFPRTNDKAADNRSRRALERAAKWRRKAG